MALTAMRWYPVAPSKGSQSGSGPLKRRLGRGIQAHIAGVAAIQIPPVGIQGRVSPALAQARREIGPHLLIQAVQLFSASYAGTALIFQCKLLIVVIEQVFGREHTQRPQESGRKQFRGIQTPKQAIIVHEPADYVHPVHVYGPHPTQVIQSKIVALHPVRTFV